MLDDSTRTELRDSIRRALEPYPDVLGLTRGDKLSADAGGRILDLARTNGWLMIAVSEEAGGLGLGMQGAAVLATEIGRAVAPGPFLANVVLLPGLARLVDAEPIATCLHDVLAGRSFTTIGVNAGFDGDTRIIVEHAAGPNALLVIEESTCAGGVALRVRLIHAPRLAMLDPFDPVSPMGAVEDIDEREAVADVRLDGRQARELLGCANLWIAAELLGVAERTGEMAIAHASERKQFGQFIGTYQGIKHRIVDDYVLRQNAAAILELAARSWDSDLPDRVPLAHAARVAASEAALSASAFCIQVHGAMGFSWEHPAHLYYKRARRLANLLGSAGESRAALGKAICGI